MSDNKTPFAEDAELAIIVKSFLLNNPYKKCKKKIWEYYTGWVYTHAEAAGPKEHADMLFFYERLKDLLKETNQIYKQIKAGNYEYKTFIQQRGPSQYL